MLEFQSLGIIKEHIQMYQKFPLPAVIFTRGFAECWSNESAKTLYPHLCGGDGLAGLLGQYDMEQLEETIRRDGSVTIREAIPLSDTSVSLLPVLSQQKEILAFVLLVLGSTPDLSTALLPSKTAEALSLGIRQGIHGIFDAMDTAALKADLVHAGWLKQSLNRIGNQSYHILRIAGNIAEYAKLQSGGAAALETVTVDLGEMMVQLSEPVSELCGQLGIPVSFTVTRSACLVRGDRPRLELAVMNLIHNSLYFTRPGNEISVSLRKKAGSVVLAVKDRGVGIPKAVLPQVWRPYFSYDNDRKGAGIGLGLALVRAVASAHNGSCRITSRQGQGARVVLSLPEAPSASTMSLGRDQARLRVDDRFSTLYTGLVDAVDSPYREQ